MAGNANSGRKQEKPFADALRIELAAAGEDRKALRAIAAQLISKATNGDMQAIKELADRTDGKAVQAIEATITNSHEDLLSQLDADRTVETIPSQTIN